MNCKKRGYRIANVVDLQENLVRTKKVNLWIPLVVIII